MTAEPRHAGVLVVGAGVGGLCAAARLAVAGHRPLLVERADRVGGRASTREVDGFKINTGAVAIELGGAMEETFDAVGAKLELRLPDPANTFQLRGREVNPAKGGWKLVLDRITRRGGAGLLSRLGSARDGELPEEQVSLEEWIGGATSNETVHRLFRNLAAAIFAVNADEIPARAFLTYFTSKGAFKRFGFHPEGTIGVCGALADVIERHGGEVWLDSEVSRLHVADGRVTGATVVRPGETVEVSCGAAISNVGPVATVELCGEDALDQEYVASIRERARPTANMIIHVASRGPLISSPGLMVFSTTDRVCNMGNLTATCPELAPEGWSLSVVYAVPRPAVGEFDAERELELSLAELRETLPGMSEPETRILDARVMRDDWPAQRAASGHELPRNTPLDNLFNVGDGVREYADGGTQACAVTAKLVVEELLAAAPATD